jgi:hypothetical protein
VGAAVARCGSEDTTSRALGDRLSVIENVLSRARGSLTRHAKVGVVGELTHKHQEFVEIDPSRVALVQVSENRVQLAILHTIPASALT